MAGQLSRKFSFFHLIVIIAVVCLVPLFVGGYMQSSTATTTTVAGSPTTITLGDTVTFTATVTAATGTATGLVTFFDGNTPIGSGTLNQGSPNQATFTTSLLSAAGSPHSITATYQHDATHDASTSSAISETVNARTSTTGVVLNPTTVVVGQSSTATVTLTDGGASAPPGTADAFTPTGPPATGRTGFTSTLFADGLVLVAGGTNANNNVLNTAEVYRVSNGTFSSTGNLNAARTGAVAVLLPNGKVLVAGGSSNGLATGALNTAELFDPNAGTFTTTSQTMTVARFGATATLLNTGKVLIAGGQNTTPTVQNTAELYDPATDTFTATGNLNAARTGQSATLLGTKVLVAGGSSDGTANGALNTAELFDPAGNAGAGTFTAITGVNSTLSALRWQPEAALLLSGKVLIAGGQNSGGALVSADLYDPVANTFTPSNHSMAQARANGSAVSLPNGMVLLAGGTTRQAVDLYDADSDKFDTTGSLQQSDSGLVSTLLNNGDVLVVGLTTAATPASDAELYAPSFNPLGTVGVTSSEATDSITGACVLTPSTSTASTCTATVTPANVATSPHTITGTYPQPPLTTDGVHSGSNNTASLNVNKADTTTTITANTPNPSAVNQSITISASVTANSPGAGTPTNTVTVSDGVGQTCTITLSSGAGNCSLTPAAAGTDTLTATYNGDANFNTSTSAGVSQTVAAPPSITKTFNPTSIPLNGTSTLTFSITNPVTNTVAETGVSFTDTLPTGLVVATPNSLTNSCGGTAMATAGGTSITLTGGTVAVNSSCTVVVNVTGNAAGTFTNTSGAVSSTNGGTGNTATAMLTVVAPPSIAKAFSPTSIPLNGTSTLTFTITNPAANTVSETNVSFTDTLPTGLVVATPNGLTNSCGGTATATAGGTSITLTGGTVAVNSSCTVVVNVTGNAAGTFTNSSGAVTSDNGGTGNTATAMLTVVAPPSIAKAFSPTSIPLNGTSTLTFTITNPAANTVSETNVSFTDTLPTGLVVATPNGLTNSCGGTPSATAGGTSISLSGGSIAVNSSCTVVVNVTGNTAGTFTNTSGAVASDNGGTGNTATAMLTVVAPPSIAKAFSPTSIPLNGTSTLTFTITNPAANTVAENGAAFSDTLPAGLAVATPNGLTNSCSGTASATAGGTSITLTGGTIAVNSSCTVVVNVTGNAAGTFTNTSGAVSSTNGGTGNTAAAMLTVVTPPSIAKAFSPTSIPLNGTSTLTFTVTNPAANTVAENGVAFSDTLPPGLAVATPNGLTNSCGGTPSATAGGTSISLSGGSIAVNSSCTVVVNVTGTAAGTFTNTSGAVSSTNGGTGNTATAMLTVVAPPSIAKAFNPSTVAVNQPSALTFTITNPAANTVAETGVQFSDTLPLGTVVSTPNGLTNNCGGTPSATAGGTSISLTGGTVAVNSSCTLTVNVTATTSGSFTNTSGAVSSANGGTGNTATATLSVNTRHTTTTVALTPSSVVVNQTSSALVTVTDDDPSGTAETPTGTIPVTSDSGDTITGTCTLAQTVVGTATCMVTVKPNTVGTGAHHVTASFAATTVHSASTGTATLTVNRRHTTTTVALTPSSVVVNQTSSALVTVTDDDPNGTAETPTGTVPVTSDSGDTITSPCTLAQTVVGTATCTVTVKPNTVGTGAHHITASFAATTVHSASAGTATLTVNTRHTTTTLVLTPSTVVVNQNSSALVTVKDDDPNGTAETPTGTVPVTSDSGDTITSPCTLAQTVVGTATCTVMVKPNGKGTGAHHITSAFQATAIHSASTVTSTLTVNTRHTKIAVSFSTNPVKISTQLTLTTTVMDDDPNGSPLPPAGTINLSSSVGSDSLGSPTCVLSGSGAATTCTVALVAPHVSGGPHTIGASFAQDDQHTASNTVPANSVLTVQPADTVTVIPSATSLQQFLQNFVGQQVTFTATVTNSDPNSNAAPLGTFQFLVDGNSIGTATVIPNTGAVSSSATFTATLAQIGQAQSSAVSHSITTKFIPNADFVTSTSTDSIAITQAPAITNIPGQNVPPESLQLNGVGATGNINFQCNVQLLGSTIPSSQQSNFPLCKITPASGSLPTTITATLTTIAISSSVVKPAPFFYASNRSAAGLYALSMPLAGVLGLLLVGGGRRKYWSRRKILNLLGMMLLLAILGIAVGCGGGFNNPTNLQPLTKGTQQGTYVVTVVGSDSNGNVVAIATIPLTIQL